MQVALLRTAYCCQARQPIAKTTIGFSINSAREISSKPRKYEPKPWSIVRQRSRILAFSRDHPKARFPLLLLPPSWKFLERVRKRYNPKEDPEKPTSAGATKPNPTSAPSTPLPRKPAQSLDITPSVKHSLRQPLYLRQDTFSGHLNEILRHSARARGFKVHPDGSVRVADILRHDEFFETYDFNLFFEMCRHDKEDRFELALLPDHVEGRIEETWWVRPKVNITMRGVRHSTHRIIHMDRLKTIIYLCDPADSDRIEKYGIHVGEHHNIRVYRTLESCLFDDSIIPWTKRYLCVTIDADIASRMGVTFFTDNENNTLAHGNSDKVIPRQALLNASLLEINSQLLQVKR